MKKLLSLTLCLVLCLCMFNSVFANTTFEDVENTKYENAVNELANMEIVNGMPDGSYSAYSNVTRAQLAKMLVEALDLKESTETLLFNDVAEGHWAVNYIKIASANKVINGYEDGTFKPEANVSYAEAVTMVMRAIGKDVGINLNGNWYDNYMNEAKKLNLLKDITEVAEGEALKRGDVALLIYNMLERNENPIIPEEPNEETDFTLSFLKMENRGENLVYSPLSIKYALKMLNEGASGETKKEIENIVGDLSLTKYENIEKVLSLANSAYIRDEYSKYVKEEYTNTLKEKYDAEVIYDPFENATNVNAWIENKTLGIIKNLLQDEMFENPNLKMLLINALAIDMEWESGFSDDKTYGRKFYLEDGKEMIATTMSKTAVSDSVAYYKDDDVTALSMNLKEYGDTQLEFVVIMPKEDLTDYVETFTMEEFNNITSELILASSEDAKDGVRITIPKFSYDYTLKLLEDLKELGIEYAFDRQLANFSNMATKPLYVSDAIHKADIEFSEEGVKAAAVTVFGMMATSAVPTPKEYIDINIDKPFMYLIVDKETKEVWFVGTVYKPNAWEDDKADYQMKWDY